VVESAQANGRSSCVIAGSREMQIFNVSFNDKSRMNGTFGASTYLTAWTGRWSVVGPGVSVDMRVFNNTRCFGSFARVSAQDAGMLDLTCAFLREDGLQTIDSTCKVTFVSNDFHYYLLMLLWNIAATVASLAAAFFAAFCAATQRTAVRRGVSDASASSTTQSRRRFVSSRNQRRRWQRRQQRRAAVPSSSTCCRRCCCCGTREHVFAPM
jgi:hypothetical protein